MLIAQGARAVFGGNTVMMFSIITQLFGLAWPLFGPFKGSSLDLSIFSDKVSIADEKSFTAACNIKMFESLTWSLATMPRGMSRCWALKGLNFSFGRRLF